MSSIACVFTVSPCLVLDVVDDKVPRSGVVSLDCDGVACVVVVHTIPTSRIAGGLALYDFPVVV